MSATANELQRIAVEESRLGIPLLLGRDVIHGFKTVLPIPLGQAATWNPGLVRTGRARGGARGRLRRRQLGLCADDRRDARPALGAHRRELRRGSIPAQRVRRRDDQGLPGRRPGTARHDRGLRQAFCRLRRQRERTRLQHHQHPGKRAAQCPFAAVQGRGRRRGRDADDLLQRPGRRAGQRQPLPDAAGAAGGVGIPGLSSSATGRRSSN
jgi:hypothetical protein